LLRSQTETYPLTGNAFLEDPYPVYHRMRQDDPVYWSESPGHWVLTRYDDVLAATRNPALSCARAEVNLAQLAGDPALAAGNACLTADMMVMKDEQHRLRVPGNQAFPPSALRRWQAVIERVVDDLLDRALPRGRMDLVGDLAAPLPAMVIAELFGIPAEDREMFEQWSMDGARFFGSAVGDPAEAGRAANDAVVQQERYFRDLLEERRRRPGDDLMSLLLQGQAEGRLTAEEVCAQCIVLLGAGHITTMDQLDRNSGEFRYGPAWTASYVDITTMDQLGNTVLALLKNPEQWGRLRDDPALVQSATEEGLRYDGSAPFLQRIAREDLMLRGQTIRRGELLVLGLGAANRDPEVFPEPDRFDIGRADNRHLAFGAGPELCLGMALARRELEVALGRLCRRLPQLRFDADLPLRRRANSLGFRGLESLPVRFD
jgi:cytochrome P450 PksS